jgi:hypothetical protein
MWPCCTYVGRNSRFEDSVTRPGIRGLHTGGHGVCRAGCALSVRSLMFYTITRDPDSGLPTLWQFLVLFSDNAAAIVPCELMVASMQAFVSVFGDYAGWAHNALFISQLASHKHLLEGQVPFQQDEKGTGGKITASTGSSNSDESILHPSAAASTKSPPRTLSSKKVRKSSKTCTSTEAGKVEPKTQPIVDASLQAGSDAVGALGRGTTSTESRSKVESSAGGTNLISKRGRKRKSATVHDI